MFKERGGGGLPIAGELDGESLEESGKVCKNRTSRKMSQGPENESGDCQGLANGTA